MSAFLLQRGTRLPHREEVAISGPWKLPAFVKHALGGRKRAKVGVKRKQPWKLGQDLVRAARGAHHQLKNKEDLALAHRARRRREGAPIVKRRNLTGQTLELRAVISDSVPAEGSNNFGC